MKAKELIGKFATRFDRNKEGDGSFTGDKIFIVDANDDYVIIDTFDFLELKNHFLPTSFCDDKWINYEKITEAEKKTEQQIEIGKIFIK